MKPFSLSIIILVYILSQCSYCQGYQCCGFNRMDAEGFVLIEAFRPLAQGRYQAIKFRGCTDQLISIQLWTCDLISNSCYFKWQTVAQAVSVDQSINFEPIEIEANDRLGVFASANSSAQLSIPFGVDLLAYLYRSEVRYPDSSGFTVGTKISLNPKPSPRSFALSVVFCKQADCSGLPSNALASSVMVRDNLIQPPMGQCCKSQASCDASPLNAQMDANNVVIQQLQIQVEQLNHLINTLTDQARPITGVCPQGFTAGTYGLGTCYAAFYNPVTFAVAAFYCRDNFVANLVTIGSAMEEEFIADFVGSQAGGLGNFWTSGMFQLQDKTWYWYDKRSESLQDQYYSKWKNNAAPQPTSKDDVCSNLVVEKNADNRTDFWVKANCNDRHYFVCEVAKICF